MGLYTRQEKENAYRILSFLGLNDQVYKRCDQLSGGQKQRVGIARALIQEPKLILCDEPIASLDPTTSKVIMDHLRHICTEMGITCMVNLHQVHVAMKYSDRIVGIRNGEVVYDGSADLSVADVKNIYGSEASEMILDLQSEKKQRLPWGKGLLSRKDWSSMQAYRDFDPLAKRKFNNLIFFALLVLVTIGAMVITEYDVAGGFTCIPKAIRWGPLQFLSQRAGHG